MNGDAVVALPGGAGSLDGLFEGVTWRQLGLHTKPVLLVNVEGYWDPLVSLMHHVVNQGFADASLLEFVTVCTDVDAVMEELT